MQDNRLNNEAAGIAKSLERIADALEIANALTVGHSDECIENSNRDCMQSCICGYDAARYAARRSRQEGDKADG